MVCLPFYLSVMLLGVAIGVAAEEKIWDCKRTDACTNSGSINCHERYDVCITECDGTGACKGVDVNAHAGKIIVKCSGKACETMEINRYQTATSVNVTCFGNANATCGGMEVHCPRDSNVKCSITCTGPAGICKDVHVFGDETNDDKLACLNCANHGDYPYPNEPCADTAGGEVARYQRGGGTDSISYCANTYTGAPTTPTTAPTKVPTRPPSDSEAEASGSGAAGAIVAVVIVLILGGAAYYKRDAIRAKLSARGGEEKAGGDSGGGGGGTAVVDSSAGVEMRENPLPTSRPMPKAPVAESATARTATALFDYTAQNPDELSFASGNTISVSAVQDHGQGEAWLHGSLPDGRSGIFPANYVEVAAAAEEGRDAAPANMGAAAATNVAKVAMPLTVT